MVITEMLGVAGEDPSRFRRCSAQRARMLEPIIRRREREIGIQASRAFDACFSPIIAQRRAETRDDLVSTLARVQHEGARLNERETLNLLRLLLIAEVETTTNLIGNGVHALARHPHELERLRAAPNLIVSAVEECSRRTRAPSAFVSGPVPQRNGAGRAANAMNGDRAWLNRQRVLDSAVRRAQVLR